MTCHQLREGLVDHARGVLIGAGSRAAIESHLEYCHECATEYARQRALTHALRAVAEASAHEMAPSALEQRLLDAFAVQHRGPHVPVRRPAVARWLAIAASLAILVGGISWGIGIRQKEDAGQVPLKADTTTDVRLKPDAPGEVGLKPDTITQGRPKPGAMRRKVRLKPDTTMDDFVALPGASGLPAFESGRIVRVDLPVPSLPAYGVELVPDAARNEVQADLLVGQDGRARAIRLVKIAVDSAGAKPAQHE